MSKYKFIDVIILPTGELLKLNADTITQNSNNAFIRLIGNIGVDLAVKVSFVQAGKTLPYRYAVKRLDPYEYNSEFFDCYVYRMVQDDTKVAGFLDFSVAALDGDETILTTTQSTLTITPSVLTSLSSIPAESIDALAIGVNKLSQDLSNFQGHAVANFIRKTDIADNLTTNNSLKVLSAKQGKELDEKKVDKVQGKQQVYATNWQGEQSSVTYITYTSPNTIIQRDENGRAHIATPNYEEDIANKAYVDSRDFETYANASNYADSVANQAEANAKSYTNTKLISAMIYKGSVSTYDDLGQIEYPLTGDFYNVIDTGINYAWSGTGWDKVGGVTNLTHLLEKEATETDNEYVYGYDKNGQKQLKIGEAASSLVKRGLQGEIYAESNGIAGAAVNRNELEGYSLSKNDVVDNLTTDNANKALSANQGKEIWDKRAFGITGSVGAQSGNDSYLGSITNPIVLADETKISFNGDGDINITLNVDNGYQYPIMLYIKRTDDNIAVEWDGVDMWRHNEAPLLPKNKIEEIIIKTDGTTVVGRGGDYYG